MREKTKNFTVNGMPMLAPDAEVGMRYTDLESGDSGTDQSGVTHRIVTRYKVAAWDFSYSQLTEEEKQYMERLFPDAPTFVFGHPSRKDAGVMEETVCYRSEYGISWRNARTGLWSGYSFQILAC